MIPSHPMTARRLAAIKDALRDTALNSHELAEMIFLCEARVHDYLDYLHAESQIHIHTWKVRKAGNERMVAHWILGTGRDARKPPAMTGQQKQAAFRKRILADDDRRDSYMARDRAWKRARRAARTPQSWMSALMPIGQTMNIAKP